jgi:hypothetical protein
MPSIVAGSPTPRGARLGAASVKEPASRDTLEAGADREMWLSCWIRGLSSAVRQPFGRSPLECGSGPWCGSALPQA